MEKTINFKVDEELYRRIKVYIAQEGLTLKEYVIELMKKDLEEKEAK